MKGQVRGQGKVRQTTNKFFWWRILPSKVHRKTPLLHWHQKKFLSPAFPMNLTWMQSKKITIRYGMIFFLAQCHEKRQVAPSREVSGHLLSDEQSVRDPVMRVIAQRSHTCRDSII